MEKFNVFYDFRTEGDAFHNCTKNKKSQKKMFSNKDAKTGHFHCFPEMYAGLASEMKVSRTVSEEITNYTG